MSREQPQKCVRTHVLDTQRACEGLRGVLRATAGLAAPLHAALPTARLRRATSAAVAVRLAGRQQTTP